MNKYKIQQIGKGTWMLQNISNPNSESLPTAYSGRKTGDNVFGLMELILNRDNKFYLEVIP